VERATRCEALHRVEAVDTDDLWPDEADAEDRADRTEHCRDVHTAILGGRRRGAGGCHVGLDLDAWIKRSRERFLEAYRAGLLERRVWADIDPDLLHAFEVDKELYEFASAAKYLPAWLYAPTEGMRALFGDRSPA